MRWLWLLWLAGCGFHQSTSDAGTATKCPFYGAFGNFYCDGFENGLNPGYQLTQMLATVAIDDTRAYRGQKALHLTTQAYDGNDQTYIHGEVGADDSGPISFGETAALRVFLYLEGPLITGSQQLLSLGEVLVTMVNGIPALAASIAMAPFETDRWLCLELRAEPADLGSTRTLFIDGRPVAVDSFSTMPELHSFGLKLIRTSQAAPPMQLWFDELALDDHPILCDR